MKYLILMSDTSAGMAENVNSYIALGWKPQGGVTTLIKPNGWYCFYQAMVKDELPTSPYYSARHDKGGSSEK